MFSRRAISTLALLAWISAASGQTTLQLDLGLWDMAPGGDLSVGADLNAGTDLDIEEDLGRLGEGLASPGHRGGHPPVCRVLPRL